MIYVESASKQDVFVDPREILRYLGYEKQEPESIVKAQIEAVTDEVVAALKCRGCYCLCDIEILDDTIDFGTFSVISRDLAKALFGCRQAFLFCATIGTGVDRIIAKYSRTKPSAAVMAQAAGAAAIESFCDFVCRRIAEKQSEKNAILRPRFSSGYGDFSLSYQKEIFRVLDCGKHIGVSLTDSLMMTPSKSVSAVIGVSSK